MEKKIHPHGNHRNRMKKRFLEESLSSFEEHEVLEMLLFYTIPQKNTNEIAHSLIQRFGSLCAVLDAPVEEMIKLKGIKEHSALFLRLIPEIIKLYAKDNEKNVFFDFLKTGKMLCERFAESKTKSVGVLAFNANLMLIDEFTLDNYSLNSATFNLKGFFDRFIEKNVSYIVIAQSNAGGTPIPLPGDFEMKNKISKFLESIKMTLLEYYIVCGEHFSGTINEAGKIF